MFLFKLEMPYFNSLALLLISNSSSLNSNVVEFQFNEWHEGTQIEPAIPKTAGGFVYSSYQPGNPDFYLQKTQKWTEDFANSKKSLMDALFQKN